MVADQTIHLLGSFKNIRGSRPKSSSPDEDTDVETFIRYCQGGDLLSHFGEPTRKGVWQSKDSRIANERALLMIFERDPKMAMHSEES